MRADWQPQVAPDLCSRCGAYWECEHEPKGAAMTVKDLRDSVQLVKAANPLGDHLMRRFMDSTHPGFVPPMTTEAIQRGIARSDAQEAWMQHLRWPTA